MNKIAEYVKKTRKMLGLTQAQLALYAFVSTKFIIDLESGKTTLKMDKVLDVLHVLGATLEPVRE